MSGDCKQQPIIFHCPVLTPTKVALLQLHGITVEVPEVIMKEHEETIGD